MLESIHSYFLKIQAYASRFLIYVSSLYFLLLFVTSSQISNISEGSRINKIRSRFRNVISLRGRSINSSITEAHLAKLSVQGPDQTKNGVMLPHLRLRIPRNRLQILIEFRSVLFPVLQSLLLKQNFASILLCRRSFFLVFQQTTFFSSVSPDIHS